MPENAFSKNEHEGRHLHTDLLDNEPTFEATT